MIVKRFRENFENKSLAEIVAERDKIIESLKDYEEKFIYNESKNDPSLFFKPSPATIYKIENEDLIMLTELINEKVRD